MYLDFIIEIFMFLPNTWLHALIHRLQGGPVEKKIFVYFVKSSKLKLRATLNQK
jgi:hypothetical protein